MTLCTTLVVLLAGSRLKGAAKPRWPEEKFRARECNCIFARGSIDRFNEQSAKSLVLSRASIIVRNGQSRGMPRATRKACLRSTQDENYDLQSADWIGSREIVKDNFQRLERHETSAFIKIKSSPRKKLFNFFNYILLLICPDIKRKKITFLCMDHLYVWIFRRCVVECLHSALK